MDIKPHGLADCPGDDTTRWLHEVLPLSFQASLRDSGAFRSINNSLAGFLGLTLAVTRPHLVAEFLSLGADLKSIQYGPTVNDHTLQIFPLSSSTTTSNGGGGGTLVFVHGGAWGSGKPWMYRLIAIGLGKRLGVSQVALVGYPVYPTANILEQRDALIEALQCIRALPSSSSPSSSSTSLPSPFILCGHSSGANICALALLHFASWRSFKLVDAFISLSGVFDVEKHYRFEEHRGVHIISPMSAAAIDPEHYKLCSPTLLAHELSAPSTSSSSSSPSTFNLSTYFPPTILLHGSTDNTVPLSSSIDFASALILHGVYVQTTYPAIGHVDPIFDMMLPIDSFNPTWSALEPSWKLICEYLQRDPSSSFSSLENSTSSSLGLRSRL